MLQYAIVGKSFNDKFNTDTVNIAAGNSDNGFVRSIHLHVIFIVKVGKSQKCSSNDFDMTNKNPAKPGFL